MSGRRVVQAARIRTFSPQHTPTSFSWWLFNQVDGVVQRAEHAEPEQRSATLNAEKIFFYLYAVVHSPTKQPPAKAGGFELRTESPDTRRLNDAS